MSRRIFISDKELSRIAECSPSTITRSIHGHTSIRDVLRGISPVIVGGARRWKIKDVAKAFGCTVEDIEGALA